MTKLLTVEEVAESLNISKEKAYELVKSDRFPAIQIGKTYFVSERQLDEWLSNCKGVYGKGGG